MHKYTQTNIHRTSSLRLVCGHIIYNVLRVPRASDFYVAYYAAYVCYVRALSSRAIIFVSCGFSVARLKTVAFHFGTLHKLPHRTDTTARTADSADTHTHTPTDRPTDNIHNKSKCVGTKVRVR